LLCIREKAIARRDGGRGNVSLCGSIEPIHNLVDAVELALAKRATYVSTPAACRKALADLSD
jgi:hypothetical protein